MHLVLLAMLKQLCKNKNNNSIHRNFCISAWKFLVRPDLLTILCDSAAGIWYDFCDPFHLFLIRFFQIPKQKLADKETRLTLQLAFEGVFS